MNQSSSNSRITANFSPPSFHPCIYSLAQLFDSNEVEAYLVGGYLRDTLLGIESNDVDIAVKGDIQQIGPRLATLLGGNFVSLHEEWDIARVTVGEAEDGLSYVDLTSMDGDIAEDLSRRDFTINALALPLSEGKNKLNWDDLIDLFDGLSDLRNRTIQSISSEVFEDDPARLMRGLRLAAQLGFRLDETTQKQIRDRAELVTNVAPERIKEELLRIFAVPSVLDSVRLLDELGLLEKLIPEIAQAKGVTQPKEHYWDVFNHLVESTGQLERILLEQPDGDDFVLDSMPRFDSMDEYFAEEVSDGHTRLTILKLACLLHDIAKPATRTVEDSGRIRFLGHHIEGAEMCENILKRLRFSNRGIELIRLMVHHHLRPSQMAQKGELPSGKAIYRYYRDVGDAAIDTLYLNMADYLAARGPELDREEWQEHCRIISHILTEGREDKAPETLPKLVTGHDIMERFDLSPGPIIGSLLELVHEAQASDEIETREEALELVKTSLNSGG